MKFCDLVACLHELPECGDIFLLDPLPLADDSRTIAIERDEETQERIEQPPAGSTHLIDLQFARECLGPEPLPPMNRDPTCDAVAYLAAFDAAPRPGIPSSVDMHPELRRVRMLAPPAPGECRCNEVAPRPWGQMHPELDKAALQTQNWDPTDRVCEVPGCGRPAIKYVTHCKGHFLGMKAPGRPLGRVYPPYDAMLPELELLPMPRRTDVEI